MLFKMKLILFGVFCIFVTFIEAKNQTIEVSGNIQCCTNETVTSIEIPKTELCYPPSKAEIRLIDHSTLLPDTLLDSLTINKSDEYSFTWTDQRFLEVDPHLKIFVECFDGTIFEQDYIFTHLESQPKIISQNVKVTMKYE